MRNRSAKLEFALHLLTSFVLVLKGIAKLQQAHPISGSIMLLLAAVILALVFLGEKLHISHTVVKRTSWLIESLALFVVALVFYQEGRQYLQYVFAACALVYLILFVVHLTRKSSSSH